MGSGVESEETMSRFRQGRGLVRKALNPTAVWGRNDSQIPYSDVVTHVEHIELRSPD